MGVVVGAPEVVAIERRERAVEGQDLQPVAGQRQVTDDLRAQQAHDVREDAEAEAREDLLGERRAAEDLATLEDERPEATPGEIGRADEAVVAAADDDRVVALGHEPESSLASARAGALAWSMDRPRVVRRADASGSMVTVRPRRRGDLGMGDAYHEP